MGRFLFIMGGILVLLGATLLGAPQLQAQAVRPAFPGPRPTPSVNPTQQPQPQQPQPQQPTGQAGTVVPQGQPTPAPRPEGAAGPAVAPVVTYRDGMLTVQALNSNLSSVVTAIRNKAGIEFEGAEGVSERVALSLGPAPEGEVLAAIFSGSKYDFVAIGRPDSPAIVQKVILTVKNKPGGVPEAQQQQRPTNGEGDEEDTPDEQVNINNGGGDPQDTAAQPPPAPQQQPPPQAQTQPKTPEQLMQEMLEMQRQKGGPENPAQVPRKIPPL
jgi:hypothetical protein